MKPFSPSRKMSRNPPASLDTTGNPIASASSTAFGMPSV